MLGAADDVPVVTDDGRRLSRIWSEADLLVAECLRSGGGAGSTPAELAAAASTVVFEARRDNPALPAVPAGKVAGAIGEMRRIRARLHDVEADHGVRVTRDLDLGFAWAAYRWADGQSLDRVLAGAEREGAPSSPAVTSCGGRASSSTSWTSSPTSPRSPWRRSRPRGGGPGAPRRRRGRGRWLTCDSLRSAGGRGKAQFRAPRPVVTGTGRRTGEHE